MQADINIWANGFKTPFNITRKTKIQTFLHKLIHRLTPCKKNLLLINVSISADCELCKGINTACPFILSKGKTWLSFMNGE